MKTTLRLHQGDVPLLQTKFKMKTGHSKEHEIPDTHPKFSKPSPYLQGPVQEQAVDPHPGGVMSQEAWGCWCLQQWLWTCPARSRTSDACDMRKMVFKLKKHLYSWLLTSKLLMSDTFGSLHIQWRGLGTEAVYVYIILTIAYNLHVHIAIWSDHEGNSSAVQSFWLGLLANTQCVAYNHKISVLLNISKTCFCNLYILTFGFLWVFFCIFVCCISSIFDFHFRFYYTIINVQRYNYSSISPL